MKNVQPDMDLARQIRKGTEDLRTALIVGRPDMAKYILDTIIEMIDGAKYGLPQPWSYYQPRIKEEFD